MSAQQYLSYTYLIGWTEHDTWYYGVRTANKHEPENDLWVHYFTSSKHVTKFRELHGEPDVVQIDETFDSKVDACDYETRKLKELNILNETKWLNRNINHVIKNEIHPNVGKMSIWNPSLRKAKFIKVHEPIPVGWKKGRVPMSEESRQKMKNAWRKRRLIPVSEETRKKLSEANKGRKHSEETKAKISRSHIGRKYPKQSANSNKKRSETLKGRIPVTRKPVVINNHEYQSLTEAAISLNSSIYKIRKMILEEKAYLPPPK